LTEIFNKKSVQLRNIWSREIGDSGSSRIEIFGWLRKMTLDVIGGAGEYLRLRRAIVPFFQSVKVLTTNSMH
jgi:hypothetical protein